MGPSFRLLSAFPLFLCLLLWFPILQAPAQQSASFGNGLSAAAVARGGSTVTETGSPLDAVEGNPAGLAGASSPILDFGAVGMIAGGSFRNGANPEASLRGLAGALPYGAFATPLGKSPWTASAAVTPEILMRANWHYVDAPGTAGVSYGYQKQETQIIAVRSSIGLARTFGHGLSAGATLGIAYNENNLNAPYIFQEQKQLAGLKVLLDLKTRGYGWNGGAGVQWQASSRLRTGFSWKGATSIRTQGSASGSASALFDALGIAADPAFRYHVQVQNDLPQAFAGGLSWRMNSRLLLDVEGDFTGWHTAFHALPINLTQGTNGVINSVVGGDSFNEEVPLQWHNQATVHAGVEIPLDEALTLRAGYSYATNPVPARTLLPLTAAIMQQSLAAGAGLKHNRWRYDAAYQAQLPSSESVGQSAILGGEYNNSTVTIWTQSLTFTTRVTF